MLNLLRATFAAAALLAASIAQAGGPVYYSIDAAVAPGVNVGVSNVAPVPAPVYVQPAPVVVAPAPVYVQQPGYVVEYEREHRHEHREHERHEHHHRHGHDEDDDD